MKLTTLFYIPFVTLALSLSGCQINSIKSKEVKQEPRWYNVNSFDGVESIGTSVYDLKFDITYSGVDGDTIRVVNCLDVLSLGDSRIAEIDFARWDLLRSDCEAAKRFYNAPKIAISYWPLTFDLSLIKSLPSTSIPYLGGQTLDGRKGSLAMHESIFTFMEAGEHNVKVNYDGMEVNYVLVARGDFNRDGYQDLFIRMDWNIENTFGDGTDWIVLTKISPKSAPMILWRK